MNVLSLFSGIGGLDLGLKIAVPTARNVCYVETDGYCQRVLAARMLDGSLDAAPIHGDVTAFDGRPWRGSVDTICGGFPCQDISNAGRREGIGGKRSGLWSEFARLVDEIRPKYVFVENVGALLVRGLDTVLGDLASLGFDAEWLCLSAAEVGAPHLRKRVFILAHSQDGHDRRIVADPEFGGLRQQSERGRGASPSRACDGVETVADANGSGCEAFRVRTVSPQSGQLRTRGNGGTLADAEGQCGELRAAQRGRQRGSASGGSAVEHAAGVNGERAIGSGDRFGEPKATDRDAGGTVAHTTGDLRGTRGDDLHETPDGAGDSRIFPPGPADREAWAEFLRGSPHLEPAVRRGAHGFPRRVDRLRCLGNAVVPSCAALAFRLLAARLEQ